MDTLYAEGYVNVTWEYAIDGEECEDWDSFGEDWFFSIDFNSCRTVLCFLFLRLFLSLLALKVTCPYSIPIGF